MLRKRIMTWLIIVLALIPVIWTFLLIEDWKRDFSQNYASTSETAQDVRLRPVISELSSQTISDKLKNWVDTQSLWSVENVETSSDGEIRMHLVRRTLVWRFKDDVRVQIRPYGGNSDHAAESAPPSEGCIVSAESQSRVGKGDLGQNPRNIRQILAVIRPE